MKKLRTIVNIILTAITIALLFSNNKILAVVPFLTITISKYFLKKYLIYKRNKTPLSEIDKLIEYNKTINFINRDYYY